MKQIKISKPTIKELEKELKRVWGIYHRIEVQLLIFKGEKVKCYYKKCSSNSNGYCNNWEDWFGEKCIRKKKLK